MDTSDRDSSAQPVSNDPQELDEELLSDWYIQQQEQAAESSLNSDQDESESGVHYEYVLEDAEDDDDDDDEDYHDAEDGEDTETEREVAGLLASNGDDDDGEENEEDSDDADDALDGVQAILDGAGIGWLSRAQVMALLRGRNLGSILVEEGDDGEFLSFGARRRRRAPPDPNRFPKVPSEKGIELMHSGVFGATDARVHKQKQLARRILDRELGFDTRVDRQKNQDMMAQNMLPSNRAEMIVHYDSPVYSGQFSEDGNFFYACGHDFKVRMYDTSNPYNWKYYKTVEYPFGQWTLTDASLSPDNKWLAYTSIHSSVCLAPTDPNDRGDPYTLNLDAGRGGHRGYHNFGIWSVRFSGDGRELVAGTNKCSIIVYDIESRTVLHDVQGHEDDVNAVCFADKSSPHILYSGSDDTTIKVWDRRSMGDGRPAGAFIGHTEGLTYIDSKGDGRYILSNGKDQTMKLWDLRNVMSTDRFSELNPTQHTAGRGFDYRMGVYNDDDWEPHPSGDNSVVTFRGHKVLQTLIRCHFSPPSSTNSRYVYSGSQDGKVWIYNMDATVASVIDVNKATRGSRTSQRRRVFYYDESPSWRTCVRDASWHPNAPLLVASAWNGAGASFGTCSVHSFNEADDDEAEPRMGRSVDEQLRTDPSLKDV
ncbi:LEC14B protein [Verticillium dahliae VdLs.17]|uniref:LEC14B protein n=1 Tax=Verticillium dahliae (strain VdLs.17 / ATCC MYA-4575 / FGSC 10137) TaxID=498257 RepID=G2WY05_VERDV|nr:LEC14B protein [Verticillium dahliae VdLs.17]EGY20963.1 LEC14B protein [Verticillium dahliae VdLs.17]KAF3350967.1 ADP-ribosylation factor-like protein 2 [Verticillium dahliae VDG2]KAH6705567.1 LEC14B protein [Verticillium dahliae]